MLLLLLTIEKLHYLVRNLAVSNTVVFSYNFYNLFLYYDSVNSKGLKKYFIN